MPKSFALTVFATLLVCFSSFAQLDTPPDSSAHALNKGKKWKKSEWIIPSSLFAAGALISIDKNSNEIFFNRYEVREERNEHFNHFSCHADNYLQYAPIAGVFALSLSGVKGKNNLANQTALCIKTQLLLIFINTPLKLITAEPRPDSGAKNSFPSGHTAEAFAMATFLAKEYGHRSIWYSIGAYTLATGVGALRVLNNRHWISDVIAGAGIGILSTNIVYATHKHRWGKKNKNVLTVSPTYQGKTAGIYLGYRF